MRTVIYVSYFWKVASFLSARSSIPIFPSSARHRLKIQIQNPKYRAGGDGGGNDEDTVDILYNLQDPHQKLNPEEILRSIADSCQTLSIPNLDLYGDFHLEKGAETSYLRQFEAEIAKEFGMDDAVFMPSGVMAQSIALLIHSNQTQQQHQQERREQSSSSQKPNQGHFFQFACHHTSHLILHEEDSHFYLLGMNPLIISTKNDENILNPTTKASSSFIGVRPMMYNDVLRAFFTNKGYNNNNNNSTCGQNGLKTLILELPHRELGGKCTPWEDVLQIGELCSKENVAFHCDGARIFEASAAYG